MKYKNIITNPGRRTALQQLAAGSALLLAGRSAWSLSPAVCILTPEQTEGPYFVEEAPARSDIRSDPAAGSLKPGIPLELQLKLMAVNAQGCEPLRQAMVDIWHCDAAGLYSGVRDAHADTSGQQFLRGYQITDERGMVTFTTIYPGWYPGRAVHIHLKVRAAAGNRQMHRLTTQLYFDDRITDQVYRLPPYAGREGRRPRNEQDGIYLQDGRELTLKPYPEGDGYKALFELGIKVA